MRVAYSELEEAFVSGSYEFQYWLDKQTGEVIRVSSDTEHWARGDDEIANAPEWQREEIERARRVLRAVGEWRGAKKQKRLTAILPSLQLIAMKVIERWKILLRL